MAVAQFYSGDIPGALKQIDAVLKANPDFQKGWLNKGIFLSHECRISEQDGDKKTAEKQLDQAKVALTKAVAIDPKSEAGKQADQSLQQLPAVDAHTDAGPPGFAAAGQGHTPAAANP